MTSIIDGKQLAKNIREKVAQKICALNDTPTLAVVLVGDNEASHIYVRNKKKAAGEVGIECKIVTLPEDIKQAELEEIVSNLNNDENINGIIVQLPLPEHLDADKVVSLISYQKDVDGLGAYNTGLLAKNLDCIVAATPKGILHMLKSIPVELIGKNVVIVGRSNIVGRPLSSLLLNNDCTVTITHSKTVNLQDVTKTADILISACGCSKMIKKDWVKDGAVVIDVGINRDNGKICGDVDFDDVCEKVSYITPVPGGVGPMTVAMLIDNTYEAYVQQKDKKCI